MECDERIEPEEQPEYDDDEWTLPEALIQATN